MSIYAQPSLFVARRLLSVTVSCALGLLALAALLHAAAVQATNFDVCSACTYTTVQAAIAAAGRDHVGSRVAGVRDRRIGAAAVGHDDAADHIARNGPHHIADRGFLVEGRDRQRDRHGGHRLHRSPQLAQALGGRSDKSSERNAW